MTTKAKLILSLIGAVVLAANAITYLVVKRVEKHPIIDVKPLTPGDTLKPSDSSYGWTTGSIKIGTPKGEDSIRWVDQATGFTEVKPKYKYKVIPDSLLKFVPKTITLSNGYYGRTQTIRFTIDQRHYEEAMVICQLAMIPYQGLNDQAKRQLDAGWKYILKMEEIAPNPHDPNYSN